jgi:HK97 family phage portal protein
MGFWSRLFGSGPRAASHAGGAIAAWRVGQPVWTPRRYELLAEESFVKNAVAYHCVRMISSSAASIPWLLADASGAEIERHKLLDLLARPNPTLGGQALLEALYAYLLLAGNTYLEGVGPTPNPNIAPTELWPQRPDRMKVIPGPFALPSAYQYEANGQKVTWDCDRVTGRSQILHVKEFHPTNDWYGLPRVEPAAYAIDRHNAASAHNKALLDNGARPSGALIFKPIKGGTNGPDQSAPPEVIAKAEASLDARHGGPDKAGKPLVFGGNVDWKEMGITPRDMDFNEGKLDAARDICTAFGVPHVLIVPGAATYNNLKEARLQLYEDTVLPLAERVLDALNAWLTPRFGPGLVLGHDLDAVPALEPRREAKRASTVEVWKSRLITRDEARQALGFDKTGGEAGDEYYEAVSGADPDPTPDSAPAPGAKEAA